MLKWLWRKPIKRKIDKIIIHCSATPPWMNIGASRIKKWHTDPKPKGNGWSDIGYHFVIKRDGEIEDGRPLEIAGAHTKGHNTGSIGICLVGGVSEDDTNLAENNFTDAQFNALRSLLIVCKADYKKATIHGHREFSTKKACPSFDVGEYLAIWKI